jgi:hypothetical protein
MTETQIRKLLRRPAGRDPRACVGTEGPGVTSQRALTAAAGTFNQSKPQEGERSQRLPSVAGPCPCHGEQPAQRRQLQDLGQLVSTRVGTRR